MTRKVERPLAAVVSKRKNNHMNNISQRLSPSDVFPARCRSDLTGANPKTGHAPRRLHVPARRSVEGITNHSQPQPQKLIAQEPSRPVLKTFESVPVRHIRPCIHHARRIGKLARRLHILEVLSAKRPTGRAFAWHRLFSQKSAYTALAVVVVAVTMYVSMDTWFTNRIVAGQNVHTSAQGSQDNGATAISGDQQPSDRPLPGDALANYRVAGPNPRALYIKKINLAARVLPMSVDRNNTLQAPASIFDTGWYTGSVKPGETGAMLVDAHSSGRTAGAAFDKLHTLVEGDIVTIETGDGATYNYKVVAREAYPKDTVDMQKALLPYGNAQRGLNLITCAGKLTPDRVTMTDRLVVYAILE
ncbi:class F sortase [Candidatus Saccharibacteria bacterium]|nr:MAG: class F sortase [Candidatus Saccharibacteria bacterium]